MTGSGNLSMFGTVSGTIKNIRFDGMAITPESGSAAVLAQALGASGVIESVQVSGNITGGQDIGGLVVSHSGIITKSSFDGITAATSTTRGYVGGLVSNAAVGSYILFSSSSGVRQYLIPSDATSVSIKYIGGLAGQSYTIGEGGGTFISSYSTADFYSEGAPIQMGGIVGNADLNTVFLNTYATGSAFLRAVPLGSNAVSTSVSMYFGGLIGSANIAANQKITVHNSFSDAQSVAVTLDTDWTGVGAVTAMDLYAGDIVYSRYNTGTYDYVNLFSNNNITYSTIEGSTVTTVSDPRVEPLPTLTLDFYRDTLGWDFDDVWNIPEEGRYPILQWQ
jgi:hypothetical protein